MWCGPTGFGGHPKGHLLASGERQIAFRLLKGFVLLLMRPCDQVCVGVFRPGSRHSCSGIVSGSVPQRYRGGIKVIHSPWKCFKIANHVSQAVFLRRVQYVHLCRNPEPAAVQTNFMF